MVNLKYFLKYYRFTLPVIIILAVIHNHLLLNLPFKIYLYIVPIIAATVISCIFAYFDKENSQYKDIQAENEILLLQQHHSMILFNKKFCHDFTNILLGLNLNFEQLQIIDKAQHGVLLDKQKKYIDRGTKLINQLISLSQEDHIETNDLNFKDLFLELKSLLETITKNQIEVEIDIYSYKMFKGVYSKLLQALLNISIDCVNNITSDSPRIWIELRMDHEKKRIEILIKDNRGDFNLSNIEKELNEDDIHSIKNNLKLSFSKKMIQDHSGDIKVLSDDNGCIYNIYLPVKD